MTRKKHIHLSTDEMEAAISFFIYEFFSIRQIDSLLVQSQSDKYPFQSGAQKVYQALEENSPAVYNMLDSFTPHPACRFSLIRDVLHSIDERANKLFSHTEQTNSVQKTSNLTAMPVFSS